jgi:hypothetical protein
MTGPRDAETRITTGGSLVRGLQAFPERQSRNGKEEAGRRVHEGGFDHGAIVSFSQADDYRIATRRLLIACRPVPEPRLALVPG